MDFAARTGSSFCATNLELDGDDDSAPHAPRIKAKLIAVQPAAGGGLRSNVADDGPIAHQSGDLVPSDFFEAVDTRAEASGTGLDAALLIPHVRQQMNWDCGIACVAMVLR